MQGKGSLSEMAQLRCKELINNGRSSLYPKTFSSSQLMQIVAPDEHAAIRSYSPQQIQEIYTRLRTEAEEFQQKRTAYMMARLEKGQHPDTNADFWKDWHDAGPPPMSLSWWDKHGTTMSIIGGALLLSLLLLRVRRSRRVAVAR